MENTFNDDTPMDSDLYDALNEAGLLYEEITSTTTSPLPKLTTSSGFNEEMVLKTINTLFKTGEIFEVCVLPSRSGGYFDNPVVAARLLAANQYSAKGSYITLNPIKKEKVNSLNTWVTQRSGLAAKDDDIDYRNWVLIDADPIRPTGMVDEASSDEEKEKARKKIIEVSLFLKEEGNISVALLANSGNGYHALVPVKLSNDDKSKNLVQDFLKLIDKKFSTNEIKMDAKVFNAARISKLYGTMACKGTNTVDRPHRQSNIMWENKSLDKTNHPLMAYTNTESIESMVNEWREANKIPQVIPINTQTTPIAVEVAGDDILRRATNYILKMEPSIQGQDGSSKCFKAAMVLVEGFALNKDQALYILNEHFNLKCIPTWSEKELIHKIDDAIKKIDPLKLGYLRGSTNNTDEDESPMVESKMEPFPTEIFPNEVGNYIKALAADLGCDPAMLALPAISILAGTIGLSRTLFIKPGWIEPAAFWTAVIANSGAGKSSSLRALLEPANRLDIDMRTKNKTVRREFNLILDNWRSEGKKLGLDMPQNPLLPVLLADDTTWEALEVNLSQSTNGILMGHHELDSWFTGLVRNAGQDLGSQYCKLYDGETLRSDRLCRESTILDKALLSIAGMVQMRTLAKQANGDRWAQGVLPRFILAFPTSPIAYYRESEKEVLGTSMWSELINNLFNLREGCPITLKLSRILEHNGLSAHQLFVNDFNERANRKHSRQGAAQSITSKASAWSLRWALIHSIIKQVLSGNKLVNQSVDYESMKAGIAFATWAEKETIRCSALLVQAGKNEETDDLVRLLSGYPDGLSARDLQRLMRTQYPSKELATAALDNLVSINKASKRLHKPQRGPEVMRWYPV